MSEGRPTYVREDGTEIFVITKDLWSRIKADIVADGAKPSKAFLAFEKELPLELTRAEFDKLRLHLLMGMDPADRREALRSEDVVHVASAGWVITGRPTPTMPRAVSHIGGKHPSILIADIKR